MTRMRLEIDAQTYTPEPELIARLAAATDLSPEARAEICAAAATMVRDIRAHGNPGLMEVFLAEYGLSTDEGIALMCLAEALLRVPDAETIDALIEDKIAPSDWGRHLGASSSSLVNASTWGLMLTGRVLAEDSPGVIGTLRGAIKRLGEPVIRTAVSRAMKEMGRQFVLGETIDSAMKRVALQEDKGYTYSYDMLGEAARTEADAQDYLEAYSQAIAAIAKGAVHDDARLNPGISVKLSALHPRYEESQSDRMAQELTPRLARLAREAAAANLGFNIDAEEADRLALSLDIIEDVLAKPELAGWEGFGLVVQAYSKRAGPVIDWVHGLAERLDRKIMLRLVKGAYWDAEVKRAQVMGLHDFTVFTQKAATDVSYLANARKLLTVTDRIYPQFATHNAHSVAAILHMAEEMGVPADAFEFQRLHGMGEVLHDLTLTQKSTRCRIYAPVGAHSDLLAYLVRRLLENGANSSFVNQIVDEDVPPETVAADPFDALGHGKTLPTGTTLFGARQNSKGHDLTHRPTLAAIEAARAPFHGIRWQAGPLPQGLPSDPARVVPNPAAGPEVGRVEDLSPEAVPAAFARAALWSAPVAERAGVLRRVADLYEAHMGELFALLAREAGKTLLDAEGELREAVDFLRYYADEALARGDRPARGTWVCISPWNFPLAIFTGQIAAALAAGNGVLAKPSEETTLIAHRAVQLMLKAGVPADTLQLLPGDGRVGAALTSHPEVAGVAFTGSTETARLIRRAMAQHAAPGTPLIAETGGLNAMIVDSTALPEHAVRDVVQSAFQSAGQRCSALRCLYVQEDVAPVVEEMLKGAMDAFRLGAPWNISTDVGPVISPEAQVELQTYVNEAAARGQVIKQLPYAGPGSYVAPALLKVSGIEALEREVFGPVLHMATFKAHEIDAVIAAVNARGFGLTFGLHTRIDDRVQQVVSQVACGNIYVNRNQIGAIVGSQPFGGEGLSGTGPKAGGPRYLDRFFAPDAAPEAPQTQEPPADLTRLTRNLAAPMPERIVEDREMPGPTGESNRLTARPKGPVLCLGPAEAAQVAAVDALGGVAITATGHVPPEVLTELPQMAAVLWWGDAAKARTYEEALAAREGPLVPLVCAMPDAGHVLLERHLCVDTTASGGNAALLAEMGED